MTFEHFIGIGGAVVLAVGWLIVLVREFIMPWRMRDGDVNTTLPDPPVAPPPLKGVQITFGERDTRKFRPTPKS